MKVALIHDHLAQDGGAEKVLKVLSDMFPEAPIYTLLYEPTMADKYFKNRKIFTSIIQKIPGGVRFYKWFLPIMSLAVEFFDLSDYDLVISNTSSFAKGVITNTNTLHLCYCCTPTRYLWSDTHSYIQELKYNKYFKKIIALSLKKIRIWDRLAADRPDYFIADSQFIAKRIKKYYRRESVVIYPPVEIDKFQLAANPGDYWLAGGRLVPYKRFDLLVEAFKTNGRKLKIFGGGPDLPRLKELAGEAPNIEFLGRVSDEQMIKLYSECLAFLNPQEEDFGITMVEALASGRPVIAFNRGGAKEIVANEQVGILFAEQTPESLNEALAKYDQIKFDAAFIRNYAQKFSVERFKAEITKMVEEKMRELKG